jgi:hypothetical protein
VRRFPESDGGGDSAHDTEGLEEKVKFRTLVTRAVMVVALSAGAIGVSAAPAHAKPDCSDYLVSLYFAWSNLADSHYGLAATFEATGYDAQSAYHTGLAVGYEGAARGISDSCWLL